MSSGPESIVFNQSERMVSVDLNRLQQLVAQFRSELYRAFCDTLAGTDDVDASAVEVPNTTQLSPDSATIWGGLRVVPAVGAASITVTPGVIAILDPDSPADPNDSPLKLVNDAGVPSPGTLAIAANASGQIRVDVIECARVASPGYLVLETDNRDIYNNATQIFTPATVNKVIAGALQYRVRQGTPGSGYPGAATGWVPLAIASVPTGTTTCDTVTFWDVRPMACDRVRPGHNNPNYSPRVVQADLGIVGGTGAGGSVMNGKVDAIATDVGVGSARAGGLYRVGGVLNRGTPGTDGVLDLSDAANQSGSFGNNTLTYVYLLLPFGLPRWARYTDSGSGVRKPRSPRGIPVLSQVAPHAYDQRTGTPGFDGQPSAPIPNPLSTGLGGSTSVGVAIAAHYWSTGLGKLRSGLIAHGRTQHVDFSATTISGGLAGTNPSQTFTWALNPGTDFPSNAKALHCTIFYNFNAATSGVASFTYNVTDATTNINFDHKTETVLGPSGIVDFEHRIEFPITFRGTTIALAAFITETSTAAATSAVLTIWGWEI